MNEQDEQCPWGKTLLHSLERGSLSPHLEAAVPSQPGARRGQGQHWQGTTDVWHWDKGSTGRALLMSGTGHQVLASLSQPHFKNVQYVHSFPTFWPLDPIILDLFAV